MSRQKRSINKIWYFVFIIGILIGIINAIFLGVEWNYTKLKIILLVILFNAIFYYLLTFSILKIKYKNTRFVCLLFVIINFMCIISTKHEGGLNIINFINGVTFGSFPIVITYYFCNKLILKKENITIRNLVLSFLFIMILVNLFLPTHINKFLALNIFKNNDFKSQKFYCNIIDNYNLDHEKIFPYIYKLNDSKLNDIKQIRIYDNDNVPYYLTGLTQKDINKDDLKKIKYKETSSSTGFIDYTFYYMSESDFEINSPNVDFNIYYNFYHCYYNQLSINSNNIRIPYLSNTHFKRLKLNDNYLEISKLGKDSYPYLLTNSEIIIFSNKKVSDIKSNGLTVIVSDDNGKVKRGNDIINKNDVIEIKSNDKILFNWTVKIHET